MKPFSKSELRAVIIIFVVLISISLINFRLSLRRSRDSQRRSDVNHVANLLYEFYDKTGYVPLSDDEGRIKACAPENIDELLNQLEEKSINMTDYLNNLLPCDWGNAKIIDHISGNIYIDSLPTDPKSKDGYFYRYIANGRMFQVYAYQEGEDSEEGYRQGIVDRNITCGNAICNYGKAYGEIPLDKSLEEYENELREER